MCCLSSHTVWCDVFCCVALSNSHALVLVCFQVRTHQNSPHKTSPHFKRTHYVLLCQCFNVCLCVPVFIIELTHSGDVHASHIIHHTSYIIHHTSYVTHHTPHIIHHTSHIIHQTSCIIHHTSMIIHHTSYIIHHTSHMCVCVCVHSYIKRNSKVIFAFCGTGSQ